MRHITALSLYLFAAIASANTDDAPEAQAPSEGQAPTLESDAPVNKDQPATVVHMGYTFDVVKKKRLAFGSNEIIEQGTSPVYELPGTASEITVKATACARTNLSNGSVSITGGDSDFMGGVLSTTSREKSQVGGGQVVEVSDPANGLLSANMRADFMRALLEHSVQASLTVQAKDGRFRIRLASMQVLQKSTGYMANDGYDSIIKAWGTGWEATLTAAVENSEKLVACMRQAQDDNW